MAMQKSTAVLSLLLVLTATLSAQWTGVVTRNVPRNPDGTVNLNAPPPRMAGGTRPDLSGMWMADTVPCEQTPASTFGCSDLVLGLPVGAVHIAATGVEDVMTGVQLPYQPWARALFDEHTANQQLNGPQARCLPLTPTQQWAEFNPQKILQTQDQLVLLTEYMAQYRQIFLDGRPLPEEPFPTFKGYSVGRWEGDTLVVETTGFNDGLWLDGRGNPLTDEGRLAERIRRPSYGHLEVEITVDDRKAYTEPFTVHRHLARVVDTELIDYICNENEKSLQRMLDGAKQGEK